MLKYYSVHSEHFPIVWYNVHLHLPFLHPLMMVLQRSLHPKRIGYLVRMIEKDITPGMFVISWVGGWMFVMDRFFVDVVPLLTMGGGSVPVAFLRFRRIFGTGRLSEWSMDEWFRLGLRYLPEQVFDQRWCKIVFKQSRGENVVVLCLNINSCIGSSISHN